jgi:WD40 repeat protein
MGHGGYVGLVNWSPDSKKIVSAAQDNVIRIFDVETGSLLCEPFLSHKNNLTALSMRSSMHSDDPEVVSGA